MYTVAVDAKYGYPKGFQIPTIKEEIRRYSSQHSARLSAHPNNLIVNLRDLPDNRQLTKIPAKWSAYQISSVIVVFVILEYLEIFFVMFLDLSGGSWDPA
jgi:hypothetical protein